MEVLDMCLKLIYRQQTLVMVQTIMAIVQAVETQTMEVRIMGTLIIREIPTEVITQTTMKNQVRAKKQVLLQLML